MSVWSKENCVLTNIGNEALTEIAALGGRMTFDSVWTCDTRVQPTELTALTELPKKVQQMTLIRYTQVSGGYTINVQVTNEDLEEPYNIEMVGVYMKLDGFNEGNPFLYMILLADEGSADEMTNISRSTYKYAIYLYHTNKAVLNITLNPTDYVATDTYEAGIKLLEDEVNSSVYHADYTEDSYDASSGYINLYTEHFDTHPFVRPSQNLVTEHPVVIIHNFTGYLSNVSTDNGGNFGVYIDDVGPFELTPFDGTTLTSKPFNNTDLICTVVDEGTLKVTNHFLDEDFIPKDSATYSSFNGVPFEEGIYSLLGTATNSPVSLSADAVWTCIVIRAVDMFIMLAINNVDDKIYRRTRPVNSPNKWANATSWKYIGGGGGVQTATAQFVNSSGTASTTDSYLKIMRDSTTDALKSGDVLMCTLSALSTITSSSVVTVRYVDNTTVVSKYLYKPDGVTRVPCCQLPKYFLVMYDGTNFELLTPLNTTLTLSTSDPSSTGGKHGDIWYTY